MGPRTIRTLTENDALFLIYGTKHRLSLLPVDAKSFAAGVSARSRHPLNTNAEGLVPRQLRLDEEVKLKLSKYAEFLDCSPSYCSPSYVVTEALKLVYRKDKEFQSWLSGQYTKASEPTSKGDVFQLELK